MTGHEISLSVGTALDLDLRCTCGWWFPADDWSLAAVNKLAAEHVTASVTDAIRTALKETPQ